jgi:hypothetical protein
MDMWACGPAGRAKISDLLASGNSLARRDPDPLKVAVSRLDTGAMIDLYQVTVTAYPACDPNDTRSCRLHLRAGPARQIHSLVTPAVAIYRIVAPAERRRNLELGCASHVRRGALPFDSLDRLRTGPLLPSEHVTAKLAARP